MKLLELLDTPNIKWSTEIDQLVTTLLEIGTLQTLCDKWRFTPELIAGMLFGMILAKKYGIPEDIDILIEELL